MYSARLQRIERLRRDLGVNLAGIAVILDLLERLTVLQRDLVGAIANEVGLSGRAIGAIDILDRTAFVEVPTDRVEAVIAALRRTTLRGRRVRVQVARPGGLA